jgi:hypothetical protein
MVDSGRIRLPVAIDAKVREDFTLLVVTIQPQVTGETTPTARAESAPG